MADPTKESELAAVNKAEQILRDSEFATLEKSDPAFIEKYFAKRPVLAVGKEIAVPLGTVEVRVYVDVPGVIEIEVDEGKGWRMFSRTSIKHASGGWAGVGFQRGNLNTAYRVRSRYG